MIVPQYWAEGRAQHRQKGRQVTVRRFGWSDASQAEAQASADARVHDALQRLLAGEKLLRFEPKRSYNGAAGVPIRDEVIQRHGETVITRNLYGARCLNTPNVFFADIDFVQHPPGKWTFVILGFLLLGAGTAGWLGRSLWLGLLLGACSIPASILVATIWLRVRQKVQGGAEQIAVRRVHAFASQNPDWSLRLYRTPAGLRLLVTHTPMRPDDPAVSRSFESLGVDPVYALMCRNQQCFRARVSAKPWRIGISDQRPRPGVWPIAPERLALRQSWVECYEAAAKSYSACSLLESIGSGIIHPEVKSVLMLHDELSRATGGLPMA